MADWTIIEGDCREVMRTLGADSVDAVVTDPPYALTGASRGVSPRRNGSTTPPGPHRSQPKGFMGMAWDGRLPPPETWAEALRVAKPGAHLVAFGGTRTFHRLTCAIEDAGWAIRDCLMWVYGSGFPKSLDVGKVRAVPAEWRGWGTGLKPAWEPIVLARKPPAGTVAENVLRHRTGALNVDGCRIPGPGGRARAGEPSRNTRYAGRGGTNFAMTPGPRGGGPGGRWPANVLLDEEAAALLDAQTGVLRSGRAVPGGHRRHADTFRNAYGAFAGSRAEPGALYGDAGGASRFFYVAKASRAERGRGNDHPTVKPVALMIYLVRLVTPPGGLVLDPFCGSGSTGLACVAHGAGFVGIDRNPHYCRLARRRLRDSARPDGRAPR